MNPELLTPEMVRVAYENGAFPMADERGFIDWYQVRLRALFPLAGITVSRSLARTIRSNKFEIRFDTSFEQVMRSCLRPHGNWISERIIEVYTEIHHQGWGHCAEVWMDGELVGGVYGLAIGSCFCAESMFHRQRDASKVALWALVERCRELGFTIFDAQVMSPHLRSLGAFRVSREDFNDLLRTATETKTAWDGLRN